MNLAILFWFYKEPEICENRLQLLKKYNPDLKIFGLYGGEISKAGEYQDKLGKYLDDFYTFTANTDEDWKWINGDLIILDWYDKQGRNLEWDNIVVTQWDMLIFDSLESQFPGIKKDEIFLSGLKPLDSKQENRWYWTRPDRPEKEDRSNYLNFLNHVKERYNYTESPMCALFILEIFSRLFFEKYLAVEDKEIGMLEYKVPTYAKIFNIPTYLKDLGVQWNDDGEYPLNATPKEIGEEYIKTELKKEDGWRIFHPYFKIWNL